MVDGWDSIRAGNYSEAIRRFGAEYKRDQDNISLLDLGCAYIFAGDYSNALKALERLVEIDPKHISDHYETLGLVYWLQDNLDRAVATWKDGLKCGYSDGAGGLTIPLLLWFASIQHPTLIAQDEILGRIKGICSKGWARNWPGPIGKFILGQFSESDLRALADRENEAPLCDTGPQAKAEFYIGVKNLISGDKEAFELRLRECVSLPSFFFLSEHFLARQELRNLGFEVANSQAKVNPAKRRKGNKTKPRKGNGRPS